MIWKDIIKNRQEGMKEKQEVVTFLMEKEKEYAGKQYNTISIHNYDDVYPSFKWVYENEENWLQRTVKDLWAQQTYVTDSHQGQQGVFAVYL